MTDKIEAKTVHEQLVYIQKELKAPKTRWNDFGKFNSRSCEDILEAVKPLLGDCSLTLDDSIELIGDRYYIHATATLTDGKVVVSSGAYARESLDKKGMDVAQITGASSSYARKYALNGLFAIDDTKDADTQDNTATKSEPDPTDDFGKSTCKIHGDVLQEAISKKTNKPYEFHKLPNGDMCFGH